MLIIAILISRIVFKLMQAFLSHWGGPVPLTTWHCKDITVPVFALVFVFPLHQLAHMSLSWASWKRMEVSLSHKGGFVTSEVPTVSGHDVQTQVSQLFKDRDVMHYRGTSSHTCTSGKKGLCHSHRCRAGGTLVFAKLPHPFH